MIGLGIIQFGYDNAFVGPLLALPLFIKTYQGSSEPRVFHVRCLPSLDFPLTELSSTGENTQSYRIRAIHRSDPLCPLDTICSETNWTQEDPSGSLFCLLCPRLLFAALRPEFSLPGLRSHYEQ